ncbi:hypothetical protein ACHHYP_17244 [Achlya hypogyna]|uniref:Uncharacterized protein n=1 Tax=Achlya hypogyna TaxID=1202772 RepID=A0A1V9Y4W0_ACHHY|nr:hypothetical protein ACHHYP_17244 [Achlya hypogyna]
MQLSPRLNDPIVEMAAPTPPSRNKLHWIIGAVVFCGVVCASVGAIFVHKTKVYNNARDITANIQQAPGLLITLTVKRKSMSFNGQSSAQVYVIPHAATADGNVAFDAFLSQEGPNATQNYVLLDGRAYFSTVMNGVVTDAQCLTESQVPPVQLMQSSLVQSKVVDTINGVPSSASCGNGKLLHLTFAGESFVFCNSPENKLSHATGTDLDMTIEYLSDPTQIPDFDVPHVPGQPALDCPVVVTPSSVEEPASTLTETARAVVDVVSGNVRAVTLERSSCGCKGPKKPCLFVHGVGNFYDGPMTNTDLLYWGFAHNHVPCCSSTKFVHFETIHNGWDQPKVQHQFCDAALAVSGSATKTVGSIILITHSMGNLIVGGAVASGVCNLSNKVSWLSVSGPLQGSAAANLLEDDCKSDNWLIIPVAGAASLLGFCPAPEAFLSLKKQSTVNTSLQAKYLAAQAVRSQHVTKVLCGVSSWGLNTVYAPILWLVGKMANFGTNNDGMVDYPSCSVGISGFSTNPTDGNYIASINHADGTFRNGDGWWGSDRKPVKWLDTAANLLEDDCKSDNWLIIPVAGAASLLEFLSGTRFLLKPKDADVGGYHGAFALVQYPTAENDGMVDFSSCADGLVVFTKASTAASHDKAKIIHADSTYLNG